MHKGKHIANSYRFIAAYVPVRVHVRVRVCVRVCVCVTDSESIVPLRKKIKDSLTRQGMRNIRGLHRKGLAEREEKERALSSERAHKQVLTVKKNMHLILKPPHAEGNWDA